jgi:hypothetical protein
MTDYSDLIKQLRNPRKHPQQSPNLEDEVADALEAQAKRIAELEAGLKPLADSAIYVDEIDYDFPIKVKAIHLQAARQVLEKGEEK